MQKVGAFSYSGYSCLRVIQWPGGPALTLGLVLMGGFLVPELQFWNSEYSLM